MKKLIIKIGVFAATLLLSFFGGAKNALASDVRVTKVETYLFKQKSPLGYFAQEFVDQADENGFDYRLLPAIAGVESTFCKFYIRGTYNCWGWGVGKIPFTSWSEAIDKISDGLGKNYVGKGAISVEQIGKIYCPPTHESWSKNVRFFMQKIDDIQVSEELVFTTDLPTPNISL